MFKVMCKNHISGAEFVLKETKRRPDLSTLRRLFNADLSAARLERAREGYPQRAYDVTYWVAT